ncbi:MAG: putative PEP-binding protein [Alphaproteobacteria bacterium]
MKRHLIIDDTPYNNLELMYRHCGVEAEATQVLNAPQAIELLEQWCIEGKKPDLITIDYYCKDENSSFLARVKPVGWDIQESLEEWFEQYPAMRPERYFFSSAIKLTPFSAIKSIANDEIHNLIAQEQGNFYYSSTDLLTQYLNENWGTNFPVTKEEQQNFLVEGGYLSIYSILPKVNYGEYNKAQALKGVNLSQLRSSPELVTQGYEGGAEFFAQATRGAVVGELVFTPTQAIEFYEQGHQPILVVNDLNPELMSILSYLTAIIVLGKGHEHALYGLQAHGLNALLDNSEGALQIIQHGEAYALYRSANEDEEKIEYSLPVGTRVSVGNGGGFFHHELPIEYEQNLDGELALANWADQFCAHEQGMQLWVNADDKTQVQTALQHGARGIGLVRSEDMFYAPHHLPALQAALQGQDYQQFMDIQQQQATELLAALGNLPAKFRLLDAPPIEFLTPEQFSLLQEQGSVTRGADFALENPGFYRAQAAAIFEGAKEAGYEGVLDIIVPLARDEASLSVLKAEIEEAAVASGVGGKYRFGAMIETMEAVENCAEIAAICDVLPIGSNDLTAEITGCARNDVKGVDQWMQEQGIYGKNPFLSLCAPVIEIMQEIVVTARVVKPAMEITACGYQLSADWDSIKACAAMGINNISVQPIAPIVINSRIMAGKACASQFSAQQLQEYAWPEAPQKDRKAKKSRKKPPTP